MILLYAIVFALIALNLKILMTQKELDSELKNLTAQSIKIATEQSNRFDVLTEKITALETVINSGEVSPEVKASLVELRTAQDDLDAVIPDAP